MGDSNICRLCLQVNDSNSKISEEIAMRISDILQLSLTVSVINEDFVICKNCLVFVEELSKYKSLCINTQKCIVSFPNDTCQELDIKLIYLSRHGQKNLTGVPENHNICRFCMELIRNDSLIFLNSEQKEVVVLKIKLAKYFKELNLDLTADPAICSFCYKSLQSYFDFIEHWLDVEETRRKDHREFISQNDYCNTILIKKEDCSAIIAGDIHTEGFVKQETSNQYYVPDIGKNEFDTKNEEGCLEFGSTHLPKSFPVAVSLPSIDGRHMLFYQNRLENRNSPCEPCPSVTNMSQEKTTLTDEVNPKVVLFRCEVCTYKSRRRDLLDLHMRIHEEEVAMYECPLCDFKTNHENALKNHSIIHKNTSEMPTYTCFACNFKTKIKADIKSHVAVHPKTPQSEIYRCADCPYETKYRYSLKMHIISHRSPETAPLYRCESCGFTSKYKVSLRRHMLERKSLCNSKKKGKIMRYSKKCPRRHCIRMLYVCTKPRTRSLEKHMVKIIL